MRGAAWMLHRCNTLGPRWNGRCLADGIFKCTLLGCIALDPESEKWYLKYDWLNLHWLILAWSRVTIHFGIVFHRYCYLWPWWIHQMETYSALPALCEGNPTVTGGFSSQRTVTRSFDVFFDLRLNKRLSKQSRRVERHCAHYDVTLFSMQHVSFIRFINNSAKIQPTEFILIAALI